MDISLLEGVVGQDPVSNSIGLSKKRVKFNTSQKDPKVVVWMMLKARINLKNLAENMVAQKGGPIDQLSNFSKSTESRELNKIMKTMLIRIKTPFGRPTLEIKNAVKKEKKNMEQSCIKEVVEEDTTLIRCIQMNSSQINQINEMINNIMNKQGTMEKKAIEAIK